MTYLKGKTESLVKLGAIAHQVSERPVLALSIGDSQEATFGGSGGDVVTPAINYHMAQAFCGGRTSVSPLSRASSFGGTPPALWLMRGTALGGSSSALVTGSSLPPAVGVANPSYRELYAADNTNTSTGLYAALLTGAGYLNSNTLIPQTTVEHGLGAIPAEVDYWGVSDGIGVVPEAVIYTDGTASTSASVRFRMGVENYDNATFSFPIAGAFRRESTVTGDASFAGFQRVRAAEYGTADGHNLNTHPCITCNITSSTATDCHMVGIRFYHPTARAGFVMDTVGEGGYTTQMFVDDHSACGDYMAGMGDYDIVCICYGANDAYAASISDATYEANIRSMIATIRAGFGNNTIIMLIDEVPRINGTSGGNSLADAYRDTNQALAEELENVVNYKQYSMVGDQFGWTRATGSAFLTDDVHQNGLGAQVQGLAFVQMFREARSYVTMNDKRVPR